MWNDSIHLSNQLRVKKVIPATDPKTPSRSALDCLVQAGKLALKIQDVPTELPSGCLNRRVVPASAAPITWTQSLICRADSFALSLL